MKDKNRQIVGKFCFVSAGIILGFTSLDFSYNGIRIGMAILTLIVTLILMLMGDYYFDDYVSIKVQKQ